MPDEDMSKNLKKGSNSVLEGLNHLKEGLNHYRNSLAIWFEQHWLIKNGILFLVSAMVGPILVQLINRIQIYFFGAVVPISRDVQVEIFPVPIGFTLWIFSIAFVLLSLQAYFRFVSLRQRIEELENNIDNN